MIRALEARDGKRIGAVLRAHLLAKQDAVFAQEAVEGGAPRFAE